MRICMIVRAAYRDAANAKIAEWTGREADALTFSVPLYNNTGTIVAYICDWNQSATGHDVQQFVAHLLATTNLDADDLTIRTGVVQIGTRKALIFNADRIAPRAVLAHLGLSTEPPS